MSSYNKHTLSNEDFTDESDAVKKYMQNSDHKQSFNFNGIRSCDIEQY